MDGRKTCYRCIHAIWRQRAAKGSEYAIRMIAENPRPEPAPPLWERPTRAGRTRPPQTRPRADIIADAAGMGWEAKRQFWIDSGLCRCSAELDLPGLASCSECRRKARYAKSPAGQAARRRKREAKEMRKQDVRRNADFRLAWQALGGAVNALAALARERTDDVRLRRTAIAVIEAAKTMQSEIER